jgi:hypothetical protein
LAVVRPKHDENHYLACIIPRSAAGGLPAAKSWSVLVTRPVLRASLAVASITAAVLTAGAAPASAGYSCSTGWVAGVYSDTADSDRLVQRLFVTNNTGSTIEATFTSSTSATTTYTLDVSVTVEAKAAIFAKIQGSLNAGVQKSMTAGTGVSTKSSVKPYSTLYGDWVTRKENARMWTAYQYSNCNLGTKTYTNAYAPWINGWNVHY